ncbi:MAG: thioesterase family protein [Alphaproteobacteria bacterium]
MHADRPQPRDGYRAFSVLPTRWMDNDIYGHVNNVNYYSFFDTAIAHYLMNEGGLDPWKSAVIGFCVESGCRFRKAMKFPDDVTAGLRVAKIGRSSVRYEIGLFRGDEQESAADGYFVHVFVERASETPMPVPEPIRNALSRLLISSA